MRCALCHTDSHLIESHIVPSFVFKWLRENSATGFMRMKTNPNLRIQDGFKIPLLCSSCEKLLNTFESPFSREIFYPLHKENKFRLKYRDWCLKFAVSVSWRSLLYLLNYAEDNGPPFPEEVSVSIDVALELWRKFLLGKKRNPGKFEQHLLPLAQIQSFTGDKNLLDFIHRYFFLSVDVDVAWNEERAFVYTKMCRIILFGRLYDVKPKMWKGLKVSANRGIIGPKTMKIGQDTLNYIFSRVKNAALMENSLSEVQKEKIHKSSQKDINRILSSESKRAWDYDNKINSKH